jgi:hypothetical protein
MKEAELVREKYMEAAETFSSLAAKEERLLISLSLLRLLSFIGAVTLLLFGLFDSRPFMFWFSALLIMLFLFLLKSYSNHSVKKDYLENRASVNSNEADAVSGDLSAFDPGEKYRSDVHDFSNDIDIFGNSSLFHYLNRTVTGGGSDILARWLSYPFALSSGFVSRQEAIHELASRENWRHHFLASATRNPVEKQNIQSLLVWLEEGQYIKPSLVRRSGLIIMPSITVISLFLVVTGILHYAVVTSLFIVNLAVVAAGIRKINRVHNSLSGRYRDLTSTGKLLGVFENEHFKSEILNDIQQNLTGSTGSASDAVKKLGKLSKGFDSRLNILASVALNGFLLWDYQSVYRLEKWKTTFRKKFPIWLEMLGSVDAFISVANYAGNNPEFAYPVLSQNGSIITARELGHPLIEESKRICNDFSSGPKGTLCIITGANMAGKSTFLRTVAVNCILAMAGAPVCAARMSFTPVRLFTSMRTTDSLQGNESYFYSELKRLKVLKSMVESGEPLFFILDEILKGTNSADKSLGSRLFLKIMADNKSNGMIATHDTSICEMENEFPGSVINKCFEIEIDGEQIIFDYKLRSGITQKMNAALLMKQMGIIE